MERLGSECIFQGQADAEQLVQPTMNMATDFYEGRWIETNTAEQKCCCQMAACIHQADIW